MKAYLIALFCLAASALTAQVPNLVNYQGRVSVGTVNFDGTGQFKFALVNAAGSTTYWSHDGTSAAGGEPTAALSLPVSRGLYQVLLGDTGIPGMSAIPASVWANAEVRLRVWFNDGTNGFQLLTPDQRLAPSGYLPDGSVTEAKVGDGAVTGAKIAAGAVGSAQLAANAVQAGNIASGAVTGAKLASGLTLSGTTNGTFSGDGRALTNVDVENLVESLPYLFAFGHNTTRQLGLGDATDRSSPVQVGTTTRWQSIAAGDTHTVAVRSDGTLWAWGGNANGQLGDGTTTTRSTPVQVGVLTSWQSVTAGINHTLAVRSDGTLWAWGGNANGRLGDGTTTDRTSPVQVGTATNWQSVSASYNHTMAVRSDGTLWAWGLNTTGQLGLGDTTERTSPVQIGAAVNWQSVAAGSSFTLAIRSDGTLWAWGNNSVAQIGDGTTTQRLSPVQVGTATNWQSISAGANHSLAVRSDGTLWAWGWNAFGQVGDNSTTNRNSPLQVGSATNWQSVSGGGRHSLAVRRDGTLWAWGSNANGQLGDGTTTQRNSPVQVGAATNWQSAEGGFHFSVALSEETSAASVALLTGNNVFQGSVTASGFVGNVTGNVTGNAATATSATGFTGALAGDVTGTQSATSIAAATVTGKALTGFVSGAGTLTATDTILTAMNKLNGNVALRAPLASPTFTGTVTAPTFSGALSGNATTATSATGFTGALTGDVTGTQSATSISAATVTGKALTGFVSGAGTVSATDSILSAINKINGNVALRAPLASPTFTGTVTAAAVSYSTAQTRYMAIPSCAFVPTSNATAYTLNAANGALTSTTAGAVAFVAPVMLPHGAVITGVSTRFVDDHSTVNLSLELVSGSPASPTSVTTMASAGDTGLAVQTMTSPVLAETVNNISERLFLVASWEGGASLGIRLFDVRITYTVNTPAP